MRLTFLGTNGWYATRTGNTVCAVVETPRTWIVLDAGDGFHRLDAVIAGPENSLSAADHRGVDLFLSHFHLDHIVGLHTLPKLPFRERLRILGQPGTHRVLEMLLASPFTARLGKIPILELAEGQQNWPLRDMDAEPDALEALPLIHSDPCWGYRFSLHEVDGSTKTVTYCTDTGPCENLERLARNADVMIMECSLAPGVAPNAAWPHLGPELAATIARDAGCRRLFLTHFAADQYPDGQARSLARAAAARIFPDAIVAEDEMVADF